MAELSYAVILTRDARRAACAMRSIAEQGIDAELLLVLNDVDDEMRAFARTLAADGARIVHDGVDVGVAFGWNLALRAAGSTYICVVHEDSELAPGCAQRLLATLRERPDAGAVGPRVELADGSPAGEGAILWRDAATSLVPELPADVHAVDYAGSSCLMLRRAAALAVGGFDARFFPAMYVDAAFGVALWRSGYSVLCDRRAVSVHRRGAMVDAARGPRRGARMRSFLVTRNRARFRAGFGDWLAGQAQRANEHDASRPEPAEIADALTRARDRESRAGAGSASVDRLALPDDVEATAIALRRDLEDELLAELIDREQALEAELAGLHAAYAQVHGERDRLHRTYADLHADMDRVHREYAALWDDRERLLEQASAKEKHA